MPRGGNRAAKLALYQSIVDAYYAGEMSMPDLSRRHGLSRPFICTLVTGARFPELRRPADAEARRKALAARWKSLAMDAHAKRTGRSRLRTCPTCGKRFRATSSKRQRWCSMRCIMRVDAEALRACWERGLNDSEIMREMGISRAAVALTRKKLRLAPRRTAHKTSALAPRILDMHGQGLSDRRIADALGMSSTGITYHRRRLLLPVNDQWLLPGRREQQAEVIRTHVHERHPKYAAWRESQGRVRRFVEEEGVGLAHYTLRKYYPRTCYGAEYEDYFQLALMGLWKAISEYKPGSGSLSNWAIWKIRGEVSTGLRQYGHSPHAHLRGRWNHALIGDLLATDGGGERNEDTFTPASVEDTAVEDGEVVATMQAAITSLPETERTVLRMRMAGETLETCGAALGVSKERARQLEAAAQNRLRSNSRLAALVA